ncbi:hypothetical protein EF847_10140 [Actinobacteria bacterium YIM 96077]|uniref:Uncharacterized protein n=1 Tax=Phytoactinopolyspora halophila TaxID=1981511 RepID=A0A329QPJ9_9ACTN|nr:hypothetical protein [Phytoactinopolyspora halophila]AYY13008.1 hypothetical protein EF847_10140 [Actinobacteria bacterium YIM 96077]RAW13272.1 hypothetical protein DPM12_13165 [Phytoactinopolyspora halophila]
MGTLPNPFTHASTSLNTRTQPCQKLRWCDELQFHLGPCRRYLGEARAGSERNPSFVSVAVISTGVGERRLELAAGQERLVFDWRQVELLATLLVQARRSYASR